MYSFIIDLYQLIRTLVDLVISSFSLRKPLPPPGCTTPPPRLAIDAHRYGSNHRAHYTNAEEQECIPISSSFNKWLDRVRNGKIDARRADGKNHNKLSADAGKALHGICRGNGASGNLMRDHAANSEGNGHPVGPFLRSPSVQHVSKGCIDER